MRGKTLFLFMLFAVISYSCRAQRDIVGNDQYRLYKKNIYIDNILKELIPREINDFYYSPLRDKDLSKKYQEYDTIRKEHNIYAFTKRAKDGYLDINKGLMAFINSKDLNQVEIKLISYILNNDFITNKENVGKLLALKRRQIKSTIYGFENNCLSVKIITK